MIAFGIGFLFSCGIGLLIFCIINLIDTIKHKRTYEFKNASFVVNGLGIFIALSMISITVICFILTQSTVNYDIINVVEYNSEDDTLYKCTYKTYDENEYTIILEQSEYIEYVKDNKLTIKVTQLNNCYNKN